MYIVLVSGWAWGRTTHWMAMILAWRTERQGEVSMHLGHLDGANPASDKRTLLAGTTFQE